MSAQSARRIFAICALVLVAQVFCMMPAGSVCAQRYERPRYYATVYRDEIGVGHVYGDYDPDVAYGIGRLIARDRPLRTMVALTCVTGRSAEVFGAAYQSQQDYWLKLDRMVRAYEVPQQAQALWNRYCQSVDPTDVEVRDVIVAYVQGILDEINAHGAGALTTMYVSLQSRHSEHKDWPYGPVLLNLSPEQLTRLFERAVDTNPFVIQQWEPFAAILFWLGGVCGSVGGPLPFAMDDGTEYSLLTDFFHFGSQSWGITDEGNGETPKHGYLQADSQGGYARAHFVRFYSRYGKLDGGGAMWEGLGPFLLNGAFTKNVAWATMHFTCDHRDVLKFPVRKLSNYEYNDYYKNPSGSWTTLNGPHVLTLNHYNFTSTMMATTTMDVYYLDPQTAAPSTAAKLWAAFPEPADWQQKGYILVDRLGTLEPELDGTVNDTPGTLYRMMISNTAVEVKDLLVDRPLCVPLTYMIGSGKLGTIVTTQQLICVTAGRIPNREKDYSIDGSWIYDYKGDAASWDSEKEEYSGFIDSLVRTPGSTGRLHLARYHVANQRLASSKSALFVGLGVFTHYTWPDITCCKSTTCVVEIGFVRRPRGFYERFIH